MLTKKTYTSLFVLLFVLNGCVAVQTSNIQDSEDSIIIRADRIFDGHTFRTNSSVLIVDGKIAKINTPAVSYDQTTKIIDLGNATLLPGFIELHAHLSYKKVSAETVLKHGITTIRDLGGPVHQPYGGKGSLRVLTSGQIITARDGYPISVLGEKGIAISVSTEAEARKTVENLIDAGAAVIKVALEPGGEIGAPWSSSGHKHAHKQNHHKNKHKTSQKWPLLSEQIVTAIVEQAHKLNRKVTAHIGEVRGAKIAINAGVDEWAHIPCDIIPENILKNAVEQKVKIVTTIDTLSKCSGIFHNTRVLTSLGADFLYGAEIAHPDIPWGINTQELLYIMRLTDKSIVGVLKMITSKAGKYLNVPLLGTLKQGAPADMIAIKGNLEDNFKTLEYPDFVMSGGQIVVNNF